jgi:hypothetical protein
VERDARGGIDMISDVVMLILIILATLGFSALLWWLITR